MTVEAWLTVTSSSTPKAAITMPASSRPCSDRSPPPSCRSAASSLASPVRCVSSVNNAASPAVSSRLAAVPSRAAMLFGPPPWASGIVTRAMAREPTTATASGG